MTPIEAWPPKRFKGKPGYSARHFATLAGAPEDPLRVAERIAADRALETARSEGISPADSGAFCERVNRLREESWARLCTSFDAVVSTLEAAPQTPVIKRLVREAKRAQRKAEVQL